VTRIPITDAEWELIIQSAARQKNESRARGLRNECRYGFHDGVEAGEVLGKGAEFAVCRYLGWKWKDNEGSFKGPDAGNIVQVRGIDNLKNCLIIREDDPEDHVYVLSAVVKVVKAFSPELWVCGWIWGQGAREQPKSDPNGKGEAWFIKQSCLVHEQYLLRLMKLHIIRPAK
jgi:hypothetical protein